MTNKEQLQEIYKRIDIATAFPELEPQDKGNYYLVTCPNCHEREAFIYKGSKMILCNRKNECKYQASLWDYVQKKQGLSQQETLRELARLAHYELDNLPEQDFQAIEQEQKKAAILETAMSYFKRMVEEIKPYLESRGYTQGDIENMGLGYYPGKEKTVASLLSQGYSQEEINAIEAFSGKWNREDYKLVFPYRDSHGQIKTLYGRLTRQVKEGEKESDKYKNFSHCTKEVLFGLEDAWQEVVIVEGFLDCLLAKARDIKNIVGAGGSSLTDEQIKLAVSHGIKSFTLCLDNDKAGIDGTIASIKKLLAKGLECYVLTLPGCKDLDEYLVKFGKEAFEKLRKEALFGTHWLAEKIVRESDKATDKGKQDCFRALIELYQKSKTPLDKQAVRETLSAIFEPSEILPYLTHIENREALAQKKSATQSLLSEMQAILGRNDNIIIPEFAERLQQIELDYQTITARPKQTQDEWLQELYRREFEQQGKDLLGYKLGQDFYPVQRDLEGIQAGLYILGAQTNIGKTAFVANLALQLVENNQELKVIYFSLDDNKSVIASRMRAILAWQKDSENITINEFRKPLGSPKQERREKVNATLREYVKAERLEIYDIADSPKMKDIELTVRQRADKKIVVVIDGLYNVSVSEAIAGKREENIERANKIKALVDTYSFPLICTAEVRKRNIGSCSDITIDDLMETGKFGYNANLVWLLKSKKTTADTTKEDNNEMVTLTLSYVKNKMTGFKGSQEVDYFRQYGKMVVNWLSSPSQEAEKTTQAKNRKTTSKKYRDYKQSSDFPDKEIELKEIELIEESDND